MSDCCFTQCFCTIFFFLGHCESVLIKKSLVHVLFMQCWCSKSPGIASYVPSPGTRTLALKHCSDWYRSFVPSPGTRTLALRWLIRTDALLALQVFWCSAGTLMFKTQTEARQAKLLSWFHSHNCQPTKYPSDLWLQWNRMTWRHPSLSCSHVYWPLGLIPPQVNQPFLLVFLVLAGLFLVFLLLFLAWNHTHAQPITTKASHPQKRHCLKSHMQSQSLQVFTPTEMSQPEITHTHTANHYKCSCPQKRHCLKSQMHSQSLQRSSHPQKCRCLKSHKNPILTEVLTPTEIPLLPEMKANFYGSPQTHRHVT